MSHHSSYDTRKTEGKANGFGVEVHVVFVPTEDSPALGIPRWHVTARNRLTRGKVGAPWNLVATSDTLHMLRTLVDQVTEERMHHAVFHPHALAMLKQQVPHAAELLSFDASGDCIVGLRAMSAAMLLAPERPAKNMEPSPYDGEDARAQLTEWLRGP